ISTDFFGSYVNDVNQRNRNSYPQGPVFFSEEDIVSVFKDTQIDRYDSSSIMSAYGYPLHLQYEHTIYTWSSDDLKDIVLLKYNIINFSKDTLKNCWIAPVLDPDIALTSNSSAGARNDRIRYYNEEDSLNLAVAWSEHPQTNEKGKGFGYLGVTLIETPAVDENGFLRKDKAYYPKNAQLGLKTYRNWSISQDLSSDDERYYFISAGIKDAESESPGDIRLVMASGPFNMLPGDTVKIVYALVFSLPFVQLEADGTAADLADLVRKTKLIRNYYQNTVTGIEEESQSFTNVLSIKSIFPNPANDFCKIEYYLPKVENVNIEITNIYGMSVLDISNETVQNGLNSLEINTKSLSSGAYFVTLRTATEHISKLINIIK
ncbi:MAG TPA: T9SS type A sorting domain-containing protein, partial [Candidatus Kapabacteria bacterium]|nr:T9SS type A sorting domain-containing protein [Candidatus Kapabacteria bacterium]